MDNKPEIKDDDIGNRFARVIGLAGFIVATVGFLLVLSGVPTVTDAENSSGVVLFSSFIMCAALAFAGIMITTLAQIAHTLKNIENLLAGGKDVKKPAAAKKKAAKSTE